MEKEFIPYTEALALKELGFDEPCCQAYHTNGENELSHFYSNPSVVDEWLKKLPLIKAPLYQQAFRWFREKYKLSGLIDIGAQEYSFFIFNESEDSREVSSSINSSYEEAEFECLKKLIEIVKND